VKSRKTVTPAEAGVQISLNLLDSRFRGNDKNTEIATSYETIIVIMNWMMRAERVADTNDLRCKGSHPYLSKVTSS
jgi:hypothetical protein